MTTVDLTKKTPPPAFQRNDLEALAWSPIPTRVLLQTVRNDLQGLAAVFAAFDNEILRKCGLWSDDQPPAPWSSLFTPEHRKA